jgi:protein-arginine kinase activator protein McsA
MGRKMSKRSTKSKLVKTRQQLWTTNAQISEIEKLIDDENARHKGRIEILFNSELRLRLKANKLYAELQDLFARLDKEQK